MLVLTRKTSERVLIGDDIEITVVSVRGEQVRLGITAPRHITICRRELLDRVRNENLAAARAAALARPGAAAKMPLAPRQSLKCGRPAADTKNSGAVTRQTYPDRERRHAQQ